MNIHLSARINLSTCSIGTINYNILDLLLHERDIVLLILLMLLCILIIIIFIIINLSTNFLFLCNSCII